MDCQDWKNIGWNKPKSSNNNNKTNNTTKIKLTKKEKELNNFDDIQQITKVSSKISQQIIQGRSAKKLTRKQLAQLCNLQENIITSYETGTAVLNINILNKIKKNLGILIKK